MTTAPAGSPEAAPKAETIPAEAAKTAEAVPSTTPQNTDFTSRISRANNPAEMKKLIDEMQRPAPRSEKPAEKAPEAKPAEAAKSEEKPAGEAAPTSEETPAAEEPAATTPETPEEPAATPEDANPEDAADSDVPIVALTAKKAHLRLPPETDQVGRLALAFQKRNRDWTLEQSVAAARKQLGVKTEEPAKAAETPATTAETKKPDLPVSVPDVDTEIDRLEGEREKATTDLRFEDVAKLDRQIRKLDRHRGDLLRQQERAETEQATRQEAEYNTQFDSSAKRASELYDFASDAKTDGGKRMAEIEKALQETDDPLYYSPNKPLVIAQMVARELRIAPKTGKPAVKTAAPKPAAPATEKPKSVIPAGGSSTTPATTDSQGKFAESVSSIRNLGDLRKFAKSTGIPL